ncbi:MAG: hypothetical protein JW820_17740 [Spirochaetales bacterium]|nr:hypothetical protein [Spirochaetales bacterium]
MRHESAAGRAWAECWRRAGDRLQELRRSELRRISTEEALMRLAGAFASARLHSSLRPASGLVEQQRWFGKLRQ